MNILIDNLDRRYTKKGWKKGKEKRKIFLVKINHNKWMVVIII